MKDMEMTGKEERKWEKAKILWNIEEEGDSQKI